jgi:ubiquinone/menaquinone biosynthesis C-methylase UbiE
MTKPALFRSIRRLVPALVLIAAGTALHAQSSAQQNAADAERLIKALDIKSGSIVAEIGAGDGALTVAVAKAVGETGRVYSNELNKDRLAAIRKLAEDGGLRNVTVVEGKEDDANLPDACCEAIFMRDVYHHFSDPPSMNASLLRALKPGGRMALIEFTPPPPASNENPPGHRGEDNHHGITRATLEKELTAAGFEIVGSVEVARAVFVIVRRPQRVSLSGYSLWSRRVHDTVVARIPSWSRVAARGDHLFR